MWDEPFEREFDEEYPLHEERVLVAVVPNPRDWELVRSQHWYRVPLARAPKRIGAEYLAFYHPKCFEDLRWSIRYYAPIQRYRIVRRRDLLPQEADHPRADALYYKIEIGPLNALPHPILSHKLRRITFLLTTLPRLLSAREINDLWDQETPQDLLQELWETQ
ncbi:MAG: hypothetical protein A2Y73_08280 [Chloroflexi bacterium RBG_13_56_8]|nr:MAG: hypothetical protein A2Y73_08280 [Chloroflexi bacterium RBG_13_56_8]